MNKIAKRLIYAAMLLSSMCGVVNASYSGTVNLNLAYVLDDNYIVPTITSVTSAIINSGKAVTEKIDCLNIYLVYNGTRIDEFNKIIDSIPTTLSRSGIDFVGKYNLYSIQFDPSELSMGEEGFGRLNPYTWSNSIYIKLFLPDILKPDAEIRHSITHVKKDNKTTFDSIKKIDNLLSKCIAIDGDTIVKNGDGFLELYKIPEDTALAMVDDFEFLCPRIVNYKDGSVQRANSWLTRYNAGLIYMNFQQMRDMNSQEKLYNSALYGQMEVKRNSGFRNYEKTFTEEHALANVFRGKIAGLDIKYNFLNCFIPSGYTGKPVDTAEGIQSDQFVSLGIDALLSSAQLNILNNLKLLTMLHYSDAKKVWTATRDEWNSYGFSPYAWKLWYDTFALTPFCKEMVAPCILTRKYTLPRALGGTADETATASATPTKKVSHVLPKVKTVKKV